MTDFTIVKARFQRNLDDARECIAATTSSSVRQYHLGRIDAIIQSWAEINNISWHDAELELSC